MKITFEYRDFTNRHCILYRLQENLFILKKYLFITKEHCSINIEKLKLFLPILHIDNIKSMLLFQDAIIIERYEIKQDLLLLEDLIHSYVSWVKQQYDMLDLLDLEAILESKFNDNEITSWLRCQLTSFIHNEFNDIFNQHGGYFCMKDVCNKTKQITVLVLGNCIKCKYQVVIRNKIEQFVYKLTNNHFHITYL